MTVSDLKIISANYYRGYSFKQRELFNIGLIYGNVCYWLKKGIIIFYFANNIILLNIKIHKLFNLEHGVKINIYYKYLFLQLIPIIDKYIPSTDYYEYVFCGYSISGAIATLASYYAINKTIDCDYLYDLITYGSPPVGNKKFVNFILNNSNIYRYINKHDNIIIPSHYKQAGKPLILDWLSNLYPHTWGTYFNNLSCGKGTIIKHEETNDTHEAKFSSLDRR